MTIQQAYELALSHFQAGRHKDADHVLRQILLKHPDHPDSLHLLGLLSHRTGQSPRAAAFIRRAILINPNVADFHNNLGLIVAGQGAVDEGIDALQKAIRLRPDFARAHNNLGTLYSERKQWDSAISCFRKALSIDPNYAQAESNLASALKETGELDNAIAGYQRASQFTGDPRIASNLLYLLHFHPDFTPADIFQAHQEWDRAFAQPLYSEITSHQNDRSPDRILRVGYVSPDFRQHAVGRFIAPLLEHHNHDRFYIHCYSDVQWPDTMSQRLQMASDIWRDTAGLSDAQLADLIQRDQIDILIDLTMHMEGNRLLAFARKPAPVQVTYLAYCGTTGLTAIDYRLADPHLDPPDAANLNPIYSEKTVRLPSYWCYEAPPEAPEIAPAPEASAGFITYGCLNNFSKVTQPTLAAWAHILARSDTSRIIIHCGEGQHRNRVLDLFATHGIQPHRVEFIGRMAAHEYFAQYNRIDIALDPFPYPGGTTSCDALWMGVPLVTLAGQSGLSRSGVSILSTVGLPDLIASSPDQYINIAVQLAANPTRRAELRQSLRDKMRASPLMDATQFAINFESALHQMWINWCARLG